MKRAGIVTITDYVNYGNRLQNYATQELLKSLNLEVESIVNFPVPEIETGLAFTITRIKNAFRLSPIILLTKAIEKIVEKKNKEKYQKGQQAKEKSFREYSLKHMQETDFVVRGQNIPTDLGEQFDYFIVGSDQIWNPNIRYGTSVDFLTFAPKNKRIALAPSFGVSSIPEKYKNKYAEWLSEMEFLSVREQAGADIIKKLTNREAPVLVDPTLMLTKEKWLSVAENAKKKPSRPYLLTYFIGAVSKKRMKIIQEIALKNNLEIVQMASLADIERYDANPGEFIDYINSSNVICTDSFHAIIFSMHMEKPFVVFDREGKSAPMSSRIDTLLSTFKFENRKYSIIKNTTDMLKIDYLHVPKIIDVERQKVYNYLKEALKN
jgi:hypothetical protein